MNHYAFFLLVFFSLGLFSCSDQLAKSYTVAELLDNQQNHLQLPLEQNPDLLLLCQELDETDIPGIKNRLERPGIQELEASFALYFLGQKYFQQDSFEQGLAIMEKVAENYLNPLAFTRLMLLHKTAPSRFAQLPAGQGQGFQPDMAKAYYYLHAALNSAIFMMERFNDRGPVDDVNRYAQGFIQILEEGDSSQLRGLDLKAAEAKMKAELPQLEAKFEALYPAPPPS
ncbi:hypothetical protein SapgrDRAFT_1277 [Saprospira grandis DSM 2844]|uniref:Uncharacterized protein n=1 Tax=Saprospira grandis DSM 2844 TaxID=694433 RepID=J1HZG2_9BACT|nr:hypothetical protein [Saprospira grandis]EJF51770.1 hypothetical protein SapgrDRAFT_0003 [Saprospira grandis DSM 2844]EJF53000.1 hypothetical protein SapgrDRAFT_1277 [Saprospira grandis DSM 2844]